MNIITGGVNAFDSVIYPELSSVNRSYIERQFQNFNDTLNDVGRRFIEGAKHVYQEMTSSEAAMAARAAIQSAKGLSHPNQIRALNELKDIQTASPVMQRWIMAAPELRELYDDQICYGYADTYLNTFPKDHGKYHYDYRLVMDGVIQETEDEGWFVNFYPDELMENDLPLTIGNKYDILSTWDVIKGFIKAGEDPTNPFGGSL
jgi:hypothetical protein